MQPTFTLFNVHRFCSNDFGIGFSLNPNDVNSYFNSSLMVLVVNKWIDQFDV